MFVRYVYVVDVLALLPRIALPDRDTRAFGFVAVRDTTLRGAAPVVREPPVRPDVVARDVTPRDAVVDAAPRDVVPVAVVEDTARVAAAGRPDTLRAAADAVVPRAMVDAAVPRDDVVVRPDARAVAPARGDWADVAIIAGAIGSANTARIDTNVEQTKNAPASKNTVPTAFLKKSPKLRLFIK